MNMSRFLAVASAGLVALAMSAASALAGPIAAGNSLDFNSPPTGIFIDEIEIGERALGYDLGLFTSDQTQHVQHVLVLGETALSCPTNELNVAATVLGKFLADPGTAGVSMNLMKSNCLTGPPTLMTAAADTALGADLLLPPLNATWATDPPTDVNFDIMGGRIDNNLFNMMSTPAYADG